MSRFITAVGIVVTVIAWAGTVSHEGGLLAAALRQSDRLAIIEAMFHLALVSVLVYGSLVYLFARWGHLARRATHQRASDAELAAFRWQEAPTVTILVPSYKEQVAVVRKTLLSAALQDYPRRSVVLLVDDPPVPATPQDAHALDAVRRLPAEIERLLAPMRTRTARALADFETTHFATAEDLTSQGRVLVDLLRQVGAWFAEQGQRYAIRDHSDRLFVELTFQLDSERFLRDAEALASRADAGRLDTATLRAEFNRLAQRFNVTVRSFERKRYANLSHEPNKAMNLNSYLGLMGGHFVEQREHGRLLLSAVPSGSPGLTIADSDYVLILDADSILHPEYTIRLAHRLQAPSHHRVAVIQTPYSAFPGASAAVERIAGATTDIQYQIHQGFTHYDATFWVGANAMVRMRALREIMTTRQERGFTIPTFIQDRTVIEDTESTVDLRQRGWQLQNYPERLAFSATPPDFGSLLIQRRRWANGGLLILPKLWRCAWKDNGRRMTVGEAALRLHYLTSLAASNLALLILVAWGFEARLATFWLPVTAIPYYCLYAVDLGRAGYRRRDVLEVYALNMLLIPVNLGGVFRSLLQACTGRRSAFGRTPKVTGRTAAPAVYVVSEIALLASWAVCAGLDFYCGRRVNAALGLAHATFMVYALWRFVGVRPACNDLAPLADALRHRWGGVRASWLHRARRLATTALVMLTVLLLPTVVIASELAMTFDSSPSGTAAVGAKSRPSV